MGIEDPTEKSRERGVRGRGSRIATEVATILLLFLALQTGVGQAFHVPSGSMERTILTGDFLIAEKITLGGRTPHWIGVPGTSIGFHLPALKFPGLRHAERGDIVVIETPENRRIPFVKRVVAIGGDMVELRNKSLYVNGAAVPDPGGLVHGDPRVVPAGIPQAGIPSGLGNRDNFGPLRIPPDHVFLLGDNRDFSYDSRFFGPLPERDIIGRARLVTLSWNSEDRALEPRERFRLSRFGTVLH
jgi:signal peptidase I